MAITPVSKRMKSSILPVKRISIQPKLLSHLLVQHTGGEVDLDGVVDLDGGVGVTDAVERKLAKPCSECPGLTVSNRNRVKIPGPPPINQIMVQRLNDTELVECGTHVRASCVTKNGIPPLPS